MSLIKCPECKKEISKGIEICPHCGYKLKKNNPILAGMGSLFIIFLIGIPFFEPFFAENYNLDTSDSESASYSTPLQVIEDAWCDEKFGAKSVCGVIVNNSSTQKNYVQIELNLYDAHGVQIGSAMDNVTNLEPHGKWRFRAIVLEDGVASYKIKGITSF